MLIDFNKFNVFHSVMAEEKKKEAEKADNEEILSEDELDAVAGGNDFVGGSNVDIFGKKDKNKTKIPLDQAIQ